MIKLITSHNDEVSKVVLENHIREEIRDSKFCIVVNEARDESKK